MADSKGKYSINAKKNNILAEKNKQLSKIKHQSLKRKQLHEQDWEKVDLNEIVEKFAPNSKPYTINGKLVYNNGGRYSVIADLYSGYLRIRDNQIKGDKKYISLDGTSYYDFKLKDREKKTHFKIKKRKEKKI